MDCLDFVDKDQWLLCWVVLFVLLPCLALVDLDWVAYLRPGYKVTQVQQLVLPVLVQVLVVPVLVQVVLVRLLDQVVVGVEPMRLCVLLLQDLQDLRLGVLLPVLME